MRGIKAKPISVSDRQRGRIEKKGMAEFQIAQQSWMDKLRKEGHGGDWGPEMYMDRGPVIYASAADSTKKIGMMDAMDKVIKEKPIFILPTTTSVKLNPVDTEPATRTLDAVERFEMQNLMTELYPDMNKISMAKRIQERGPFRSSFEAQSGKSTPQGSPVKLTGEISKKMRSQILGVQPTRAEKLSARQTKDLRNRITGRIYRKYEEFLKKKFPVDATTGERAITKEDLIKGAKAIGASEAALLEEILVGSHQYIDGSERTKADFKRMAIAYNQARKNNTPFMKKLLPKLKLAFEQMAVFEGFDKKFLNALSPTAESITEPSVIHLIYDIESKATVLPGDFFDRYFMRVLTGEPRPGERLSVGDPAFVREERAKAANRFMAVFGHNKKVAARAVLEASQNAFMSDRGIIDTGFFIKDAGLAPEIAVSDALDNASNDRKKGKAIKTLFDIDSKLAESQKQLIMRELVKRGLAFPIGGMVEPVKPKKSDYEISKGLILPDAVAQKIPFLRQEETQRYKRDMANYKALKAQMKKARDLSQFYLVPVFSSGFSKRPKGWDSRWVVPTFQILEEYADVLTSRGDKPSALELLYLIATRSKALYDYELSEAETMLIYTMLDPHDYKKTKRANVKRNPPVNILPGANIKASSLGDPFDDERAEYVFKYLTRQIEGFNEADEDDDDDDDTTEYAPLKDSQNFVKKTKNLGSLSFKDREKLHKELVEKGFEWTGKEWQKKSAETIVKDAKEKTKELKELIEEAEDAEEEGDIEELEKLAEEIQEITEEEEGWIDEDESYGTADTISEDEAELLNYTSTQFHSKIKKIVFEKTPPNGNEPGNFDDFASLYTSDIEAQPLIGDTLDEYMALLYDAYNDPSWIFRDPWKSIWEGTSYELFGKAIDELETVLEDAIKAYNKRKREKRSQESEKGIMQRVEENLQSKTEDKKNDGESVNRGDADKDDIHPIRKQIEYEELMDDLQGKGNWNRNPKRAGLSMQPPSIFEADSKSDASRKQERLLRAGYDYTVMQKGKKFIVANQKSKQFHKAQKEGYEPISIDSFMGEKALTMARKKAKKNPITAECQKCGHKQTMKSLKDKCEKCGHDKFKSGEYTKRKTSHSCTYKKTKRSKPCTGRVSLMKNGRIYKCKQCGAKYEMR
tara:strand:- start:719 stop:4159 length:3441 start_codon:yes stop_codon:yes gene_type:complete